MNQVQQVAKELASYGRNGDTMLAHITPHEAEMLRLMGGAGTINPITGLPEYRGGLGGFFHSVTQYIAPIAIVAVAIVAPEIIPAIGTALGASGTAATVVGSSVLGAASGAAQAALTDKSIGKGALVGGATGAVTAGIGEVLPADTSGIVSGATKGAASGLTSAQLSGQNLKQSLTSAEIGGVTGAVLGGVSDVANAAGVPSDITRGVTTAASPFLRQDVSNLFGGQSSTGGVNTSKARGTSPYTTTTSSPLTGGAGTSPGSSALAQALNLGGGDISPPVNIGGGDKTSPNVWNQASLRTKDETGSA
jgi:hypothetical protein